MRPRDLGLLLVTLGSTGCASQAPRPSAPPPIPTARAAPARPVTPTPPPAVATAATAPPPSVLKPCPVDSAGYKAARAGLDDVSARIRALTPKDDVSPVARALATLVEGACWSLVREDFPGADAFTSSASLREFWSSGGESWAEQVLSFEGDEKPVVYTIPSPRKALSREATPQHPLAPFLLCAEADASCGKETLGWRRRAERTFVAFDRLRALEHAAAPPEERPACEKRAAALPELERFADFRDCMRESTTPTTMLPLGSFKAPREGWLVVRGRRGHYSFCDETRAYDLATGSAYVVRSCGGLSLRNDGSVDHGKTRATQKRSDEAGRLAVDALREAAFVMALTEDVDRNVVTSGFGWYLPEGVPAARADETHGRGFAGSYRSSSGQTSLDWSWIVRGHAIRSGTLTWPEDYNDAARAHAVELLAIAETTFVAGCPPGAPPTDLVATTAHGRVSGLDGDRATLAATQRDLASALARLGQRACASSTTGSR